MSYCNLCYCPELKQKDILRHSTARIRVQLKFVDNVCIIRAVWDCSIQPLRLAKENHIFAKMELVPRKLYRDPHSLSILSIHFEFGAASCMDYGIFEAETRVPAVTYNNSTTSQVVNVPIHDDVSKWKHFRVTGPLWGEFTGPGEFTTQRPVTRSFDVFFDLRLNKRFSKQPWGWWFEMPSWSLWSHCNA